MAENLMIAHREWATRPADQRFQTLDALQAAVERRRYLSREVSIETKAVRLEATPSDSIQIAGTGARLSHWSFGQASVLGKAPTSFLRELPAPMACEILNHRLQNAPRESLQLLVAADNNGEGTSIRAFTSDRYGRIWDADVVRMVRQVTDGTSWRPPLGYAGGQFGAPLVPSGLYASDRDCFLFMVDETHPIEVRGDRLHRGFIVANSETGARTFHFLAFLYRVVCGNSIVWGSRILTSINVRHIGNAMERASYLVEPVLKKYIESDTTTEVSVIQRAMTESVGRNDDEVASFLMDRGFNKVEAADAVHKAHEEENGPANLWNVVQGLTALAREKPYIDERISLERRAGMLLEQIQ